MHIPWESKARSFVEHSQHVILFSELFMEIREVRTGHLVQVVEGQDIRFLSQGASPDSPIFVVRMGMKNDEEGQFDEILELSRVPWLQNV